MPVTAPALLGATRASSVRGPWCRSLKVVVACALVAVCSCGSQPTRDDVVAELHSILARSGVADVDVVVHDVFSGRGGSGYVEKHVVFDLRSRRDADLSGRFMAGTHLKSGETLRNGEVVITYLEARGEGFHPTYWTLLVYPPQRSNVPRNAMEIGSACPAVTREGV